MLVERAQVAREFVLLGKAAGPLLLVGVAQEIVQLDQPLLLGEDGDDAVEGFVDPGLLAVPRTTRV